VPVVYKKVQLKMPRSKSGDFSRMIPRRVKDVFKIRKNNRRTTPRPPLIHQYQIALSRISAEFLAFSARIKLPDIREVDIYLLTDFSVFRAFSENCLMNYYFFYKHSRQSFSQFGDFSYFRNEFKGTA